jgi:hypothetical protein
MNPRRYRIVHRRDFISGMDWRLMLSGQPIGGYAAMQDGFGGKYLHEADAIQAGETFIATGLIPAFQTDERHRALGRQQQARAA